MHTRLTDDEEAVREVFDGFFSNESPIEVVRAAEPGGHDAELWAKLAATGAPEAFLDSEDPVVREFIGDRMRKVLRAS